MKIRQFVLPALLVFGGLAAATGLTLAGQSSPERKAVAEQLTTVAVVPVAQGAVTQTHTAVGEVSARQDVTVTAEVSGTITWVAAGLHAGARIPAGEAVARLDLTTFNADVAAAEATLASAEEALALESGQGTVAALEASLVGPIEGSNPALLRREPQRATAEADLASAQAALAQAKRQRALATIRAPFDAVLAEESLDVGQLVSSGSELGRWVGTGQAEILVSAPLSVVAWFEQGDVVATVRPSNTSLPPRTASLVRSTGVVDTTTRTAQVLVVVDGPYDAEQGPLLLPGSFAEVTLKGPEVTASVIPKSALIEGGAIWSVTDGQTLQRVPVDVLWSDGDDVVITSVDGLESAVSRPTGTLIEGQAIQVTSSTSGEG